MRIVWSLPFFVAFSLHPAVAQVAQQENHSYDELGRLTSTTNTGTYFNGETRSICYDEAGNRVEFEVRTNGATTTCPAPTQQTPPAGPPEPSGDPVPDPPANYPPVAEDDLTLGNCSDLGLISVTGNDRAPEQGEGITLLSITFSSGDSSASASINQLGDVTVVYPTTPNQSAFFTYVIQDDAQNQAQGELRVQSLQQCTPLA